MGKLWNRHQRVTAALVVAVMATTPSMADESLDLTIEVSVTHDDNVTRGYGTGNILSDQFATVQLGKSWRFPVTSNTRVLLQAFGGYNSYFDYNGLSHGFLGLQGDFQYRSSGQFSAPTISFTVRTGVEEYQSEARDSFRYMAGIGVRQPVTDRLQILGALQYLFRDSESAVFDTNEVLVRLSADLALTRRGTLYLTTEYRLGDIVATGVPAVAYVDLATAITPDDAFSDTVRYAYRMDGRVALLQLGYSQAFGERHALDLSWRLASATPDSVANSSYYAQEIHYTVNQYTLAYLVRF